MSDEHLELARQHQHSGNAEKARNEAGEALKNHPESTEAKQIKAWAHTSLGRQHFEAGDFQHAIYEFGAAHELYQQIKDDKAAREVLRLKADAHHRFGEQLNGQRNYSRARDEYGQASQLYHQLGLKTEYEQALSRYKTADWQDRPRPASNYNIHIEHATGLVIGNQAQVTQAFGPSHTEPADARWQKIEARLLGLEKTLRTGFGDLKRGQAAIYRKIDEAYLEPLDRALEWVHMGRLEQAEMARTLDAIRRALRAMQSADVTLNTEMREAIAHLESAVESNLGLQQKLELTLPIIPMFLDYKVEWAAGSVVDLNAVRDELRQQWQALTDRSRGDVSSLPSSAQPPSANLPAKSYSHLWGRESDLIEVISTLASASDPPIVAISGLGGIGKTALAQEAADRSLSEGLFTGVVWESAKYEEFAAGEIISLDRSALTRESLFDAIGRQLGRSDIPKLKPDEKRAAVRELLRRDRYLIVVDNLETVEDYKTLVLTLRDLLGKSRALLTSRHRLEQIEGVRGISLSGLDRDAAMSLIRAESDERGISAMVTVPDESLHEIHATTGGAPLALKLIVGQVAGGLPLEVILANLREAKGDIYPFIYRASWEQLSVPAQKILIYIGRTVPATATISYHELTGTEIASGETFQNALNRLIELSLVVPSPGLTSVQTRYGVHPLTRHFVLSDLPKLWQASSRS